MLERLNDHLAEVLGKRLKSTIIEYDELTLEVEKEQLLEVCSLLKDSDDLKFEQLMDLTVVDYQQYGLDEWATESASGTGFSRGRQAQQSETNHQQSERFAVVYHLLSIAYNQRLRVKCFVKEARPSIDSVIDIWNSANWFEREAFDLFGVLFIGHPDLRRLLTDYGFVGHPFRKDFPLIGNVEMRYDAKQKRCVYEPVSIEPRVLVPKVIRADKEQTIYVASAEAKGANGPANKAAKGAN